MKTTETTAEVQAEPQPWRSPEERKGWHRIARVHRRPGDPPVGHAYLVKLSREQARWLEQEAAAAGMAADAYLATLIEAARC